MERSNFIKIPIEELLKKKIRSLMNSIWENKVNNHEFGEWVSNFKGEVSSEDVERLNMLFLLSKFSFIGEVEVKFLLKHLYKDLFKNNIIRKIRKELNDTKDFSRVLDSYNKILEKTRFVSVGNVAESSAHLLYWFRQQNELHTSHCISQDQIYKTYEQMGEVMYVTMNYKDVDQYIFVDDFIGSGNQAVDKLSEHVGHMRDAMPNVRINFYVLVATEEGIEYIRNKGIFDEVESVFTLDESFKSLSNESRYFLNSHSGISLETSRLCAEHYGKILQPRISGGYNDCQLLLGFSHNTPDNSLPIFWSETNGWKSIFKRYEKK